VNFRPERVGKLISNELSKLLQKELEFDGALVTITHVDIDKKIDQASVGVSVIPKEKELDVINTLSNSAGQLQHKLKHHLNIKPMPHLIFRIDNGSEHAARIEKLLLDEKPKTFEKDLLEG
jgi:ribosome-binding factor A